MSAQKTQARSSANHVLATQRNVHIVERPFLLTNHQGRWIKSFARAVMRNFLWLTKQADGYASRSLDFSDGSRSRDSFPQVAWAATNFVVLHSIDRHNFSNIRKSFDMPPSHHKLSFERQGTRAQQLYLPTHRLEDRGGDLENVHELLDNHGIFLNDKHHAQ
jgi:hypothetical protein